MNRLNEEHPYGPGVEIIKHECVGHVQKRLGKRLRDAKKKTYHDSEGKVLKLKWGGKGRLTEVIIDRLQVYYGGAMRNHPGDNDGMEKAIWAVFYHSISTDSQPDHQYCPSRPDSWCKYNRALAVGDPLPEHNP